MSPQGAGIAKHKPLADRAALLARLGESIPLAAGGDRQLGLFAVEVRGGGNALTQTQYDLHGRFLRESGRRIRSVLRPGDLVAKVGWERLGVVLFPLRGEGHALLAATKILAASSGLVRSRTSDAASSDAHVGVVLYPQFGHDAEHLMRLADIACDQAAREESRIAVYDARAGQTREEDSLLVREFRAALEHNAIELYYQPKIDILTGRCTSAEALLRWQRTPGVFVPPPMVVPLAERYGLTALLTSRVLKAALRGLAEFRASGLDITVAANLCAFDVIDPELPDLVRQGLTAWGVPPAALTLEVTEGALISNAELAMRNLGALRALGCRIAIDDFGTGYSSFAYLKKMPVDELKVDQLFVRNMTSDPRDAMIVRSIIELAHNLGLSVVAEGVSDAPTVGALRALGCEQLQGYLVSPPLAQRDFELWARDWAAQPQKPLG